ncbi:MAG: glycosyltransferase family 8 protein [Alphaproteobacteria bacterium]|nr:glycosyltransferase family 8 protein [Alphaproteobacteria bacterium]MBQ4471773.1 glycosyltransferase family 8 protein [Alphaproteobacteria bacterium]
MKKRIAPKKKHRVLKIITLVLGTLLLLSGLLFGLVCWDFWGYHVSPENNIFDRIKSSSCWKTKAQDVHIAYITDENYIYPTQVSVYSAIKNKCPKSTYYFHIITDNVQEEKVKQAFEPFAREDVHFNIVPQTEVLDIEFSEYLPHLSSAALLKLMIPVALPDVPRVIYLDSDTLVMKDLQDLYNTELGDNILAGVRDVAVSMQRSYFSRIGYKGKNYINAGMLLLDLNKMREQNLSDQLNQYVTKSPFVLYIEQDAYNVILQNQIKLLHYEYNCMPGVHFTSRATVSFKDYLRHRFLGENTIDSTFIKLYKSEFPLFYRNMFDDVVVFHYFGFAKPWRGPVMSPQVQLFFGLWNKYANNLAKEFGIKKTEVIFNLPRKNKKQKK